MPSFTGGPNFRAPFGRNQWLRSTQDVKFASATVAASTITAETIDGFAGQKILQPGTILAKITSGTDSGKVGPYQPATGNDVITVTVTGTPTGGTFKLAINGITTDSIAYNASAATVQAALEALPGVTSGGADVVVTGGPGPGTPWVLTFQTGGLFAGSADPVVTVDDTALTGGATPAVAVTEVEGGGTAGATDGRQLAKNIVGINNTFLPWQLMRRDVEVAVAYEAVAVQANCLMYSTAGARVAIDTATARACRLGLGLSLLFV